MHIVGFGTEPKSILEPSKDTLPIGKGVVRTCAMYAQLTSTHVTRNIAQHLTYVCGRVRYESTLYMQPTCHAAIASQKCYSQHYLVVHV